MKRLSHCLVSLSPRCAVDLQTDSGDNDIAFSFYFYAQFEDDSGDYVICNTRQEGKWVLRRGFVRCPSRGGSKFELCLQVESSEFKVSWNSPLSSLQLPVPQLNQTQGAAFN